MANGQTPQAAAAVDHPVAHFPKQAIVVIHGMGEQMPMDTIKGFVHAAWETVTDLTANGQAWWSCHSPAPKGKARRLGGVPTSGRPAFFAAGT